MSKTHVVISRTSEVPSWIWCHQGVLTYSQLPCTCYNSSAVHLYHYSYSFSYHLVGIIDLVQCNLQNYLNLCCILKVTVLCPWKEVKNACGKRWKIHVSKFERFHHIAMHDGLFLMPSKWTVCQHIRIQEYIGFGYPHFRMIQVICLLYMPSSCL